MTQTAHKGKLYQLQYLIDLSCFIISHMLVFGCPIPFDSTKLIYFANSSHKADSPTGVLREGDGARRRAATVRSVEASDYLSAYPRSVFIPVLPSPNSGTVTSPISLHRTNHSSSHTPQRRLHWVSCARGRARSDGLCQLFWTDYKRGIPKIRMPLLYFNNLTALHWLCFVHSYACNHWTAFGNFFCFIKALCINYRIAS